MQIFYKITKSIIYTSRLPLKICCQLYFQGKNRVDSGIENFVNQNYL
jgi:hypothetical protein